MRKVFIAGGAHSPFIGKFHPDFIWKKHPDFGKKENPTLQEYIRDIAIEALATVSATAAAVDKAFVGNFVGELFSNQGHLGAALAAADPDLNSKPIMRVEGACASGGLALAAAVDAIRAGSDVVLVVGAEVQNTQNAKIGADYLARAADYDRQRAIDEFTFPALFARRAKAIVEQTDNTLDDFARVAVKAYANANKNLFAHMRAVKIDLDHAKTANEKNPNFLKHAGYNPFLRITDCSQVSDGASALVVCSEEGLKRLSKTTQDCVEILSSQVATASLSKDPAPVELANTTIAINNAYEEAKISAQDIQVAEIHDCFTCNEVLMYEALGLAELGKGGELLREGKTEIDGLIPVNTGGGLCGFGHPVGATGVKQALEIFRQMKGQCDAYQMPNTPTLGIAVNMGGDDRTSVVHVLKA